MKCPYCEGVLRECSVDRDGCLHCTDCDWTGFEVTGRQGPAYLKSNLKGCLQDCRDLDDNALLGDKVNAAFALVAALDAYEKKFGL